VGLEAAGRNTPMTLLLAAAGNRVAAARCAHG